MAAAPAEPALGGWPALRNTPLRPRHSPAAARASNSWRTPARTTALNRRRANGRRREEGLPDDALPAPGDGPEEAALKAEAVRALWAAVDRLDRRERDLFLRKYYYYQSTAQIAAELGLSLRAVEGKLYRVRKRLQNELGGVYRG